MCHKKQNHLIKMILGQPNHYFLVLVVFFLYCYASLDLGGLLRKGMRMHFVIGVVVNA